MITLKIDMSTATTILANSTTAFHEIEAPTRLTCSYSCTKGVRNLAGGVSPLTEGKRAILVHKYKCFHGIRYRQRYLNSFVVYSARGDGPIVPQEGRELMDRLNRIQTAARVFIAALFWISLFFGASVWGGKKGGSNDKKDPRRKP